MENINRHNYEVFFLDALENRLSIEQEKEFAHFLLANPDLAEEFNALRDEDLSYSEVSDAHISLPDPEYLLSAPASQKEVEQLIIKVIEGDANAEEEALLQEWSSTSALVRKEKLLFEKTKLVADPHIVFPHKSSLLKKEKGRVIAWSNNYYFAAAASVALLLGILFFPVKTPQALSAWNGLRELPAASVADSAVNSSTTRGITLPITTSPAPQPFIPPFYSESVVPQDVAQTEEFPKENVEPAAPTINDPIENSVAEIVVPPVNENNLPMAPIVQPKEAQKSKNLTSYHSLWDFATAQAKQKLWGDASYPEEKFAVALAQREIKKRSNNTPPKIEYEKKSGTKEETIRLKIGNFELKRKR
jgi:hypothetical protein